MGGSFDMDCAHSGGREIERARLAHAENIPLLKHVDWNSTHWQQYKNIGLLYVTSRQNTKKKKQKNKKKKNKKTKKKQKQKQKNKTKQTKKDTDSINFCWPWIPPPHRRDPPQQMYLKSGRTTSEVSDEI